jgi:hypothetical protein
VAWGAFWRNSVSSHRRDKSQIGSWSQPCKSKATRISRVAFVVAEISADDTPYLRRLSHQFEGDVKGVAKEGGCGKIDPLKARLPNPLSQV